MSTQCRQGCLGIGAARAGDALLGIAVRQRRVVRKLAWPCQTSQSAGVERCDRVAGDAFIQRSAGSRPRAQRRRDAQSAILRGGVVDALDPRRRHGAIPRLRSGWRRRSCAPCVGSQMRPFMAMYTPGGSDCTAPTAVPMLNSASEPRKRAGLSAPVSTMVLSVSEASTLAVSTMRVGAVGDQHVLAPAARRWWRGSVRGRRR